jgi:predicted DNA-binding antitoxin AbrB/MazE fold protein
VGAVRVGSRRARLISMRHIGAEYRDGLLKPDQALDLRAGERVKLIVLRKGDPSRWNMAVLAGNSEEDTALAETGIGDWADALDREDDA